jgi:hypothetical protein
MKNLYTGIYKSLIFASIILLVISFFTSGNTTIGALISGYSVLTLSILMILVILLNNLMPTMQGKPTKELLMAILMAMGPFFLMLFVIGIILYLIITYKNVISDGHVSNNYYTFSNITVLLFLLQSYLLYTDMDTDKFELTKKISKITSSLVYLIGVLTLICSLTLYTILKYFTTDG